MAMLALTMDLAEPDPADVGGLGGDTQLDRPGAGVGDGDRRRTRRDGPVALSALFDDALRAAPGRRAMRGCTAPAARSGRLPVQRQPARGVPRALFLDRRLTPLERNAWQVFRLQLNDDGVTAFPPTTSFGPICLDALRAQVSHETVARLTLLRLTRWLSLVRRRRDPKTGRILGNLYVLHDEPLTPFRGDAARPDYLGLVSQALTHAAKAVQIVGMNTLREIAEDPMLSGRTLPTRLQVLAQRMARMANGRRQLSTEGRDHESEEGQEGLLREWLRARLRNPKQGRNPRQTALFESEGGPYST